MGNLFAILEAVGVGLECFGGWGKGGMSIKKKKKQNQKTPTKKKQIPPEITFTLSFLGWSHTLHQGGVGGGWRGGAGGGGGRNYGYKRPPDRRTLTSDFKTTPCGTSQKPGRRCRFGKGRRGEIS